jgi:thiamine-monophosphate kinase
MAALARAVDIPLVGGNFTAAQELSITLTAAGHVPPGRALLRSGGRVGDVLYVSGTLGDAAAGLSLLAGAAGRRGASALVARQRRPLPRVRLGLLARRYASAAVDVSDGLAQDVGHLCAASGVGAELEVEALPLSDALLRHVKPLGRAGLSRAQQWALSGGEDYELVLAVPPSRARALEAAARRAGEPLTRVGRLVRGRGVRLLTAEGRLLPPPAGFDHFGVRRRGGRGSAI